MANLVREAEDETGWARLHARQAIILGVVTSAAYLVLLAMPLVIVLVVPALTAGATIAIYAVGLIVDFVVAIALLVINLRYAARAARGELFSIPLVTPVVDRWIRATER